MSLICINGSTEFAGYVKLYSGGSIQVKTINSGYHEYWISVVYI